MAYLVLARKYRPQTFADVVSQEHVTRTLENAIRGGRMAHAILFSGPRGTGKTTIARILAKAMNCQSGPTPVPCNACHSCLDITAGRGADVFEIDGASNNSVDQVRELRDNIRYMPAHSRYKIYIIDEVHMLSIAAFNALLKTLEEPPAHVMFFFATTEAHKIPITILSRCQRHDLKRIDLAAISEHLERLCRQEGIDISSENRWAIARESGGSMRDALSLLDHILAWGHDQLDDEWVINLLGGTDRRLLFDLSEAVFARDMPRVLAIVDRVYRNGHDLKRFFADLLMHFRHLMLVKMESRPEVLTDLSAADIDTMGRQVAAVSIALIEQVFGLLFKAEAGVRHASQPRLAIEMVFFKIHQTTPALPIDLLIDCLDRLLKEPDRVMSAATVPAAQACAGEAGTSSVPAPPSRPTGGQPASGTACTDPKPSVDRGGGRPAEGSAAQGWEAVIAMIAKSKPAIAAALSRAQLVSASQLLFQVVVNDNDYTINMVKKNQALIEAACREQAGFGIQFDFGGGDSNEPSMLTAKQKMDAVRLRLLNHPLVADAVEIFAGKIDEINVR